MDFQRSLPPRLFQHVTQQHPYRFESDRAAAGDGLVQIDANWHVAIDESCGPLTCLAAKDLVDTLRHTFGVRLSRRRGEQTIYVSVDPAIDPQAESYDRVIAANRIVITARDDEGAMRALFHLRQEMLNARSPILELGKLRRRSQWRLRMTSPVLHRAFDEPQDYLDLPQEYLLNIARYGYNATFLYGEWMEFMSPKVAGTRVRAGWKQRLVQLERAAAYLGQYGIRLLFHINTLPLPANHRLFRKSPPMRGAQTMFEGQHCLCSSSPDVLALYERGAQELFEAAPSLSGVVMLIGGECFLHCFTRPIPKPPEGTNCRTCGGRDPAKVIAGVVNAVARGARRAKYEVDLLVWPYSAFSWGDLPTQKRLIDQLDRRITLLSAFEKDDWHSIHGTRAYVFDYSISRLGPSPLFDALQRHAKSRGLRRFAKTETSQSIEMFYVPRIPIMQRWAQRYQRLRDMKLDGLHTTWRFYGFCAQRTDEIVDYFNWVEKPDAEQLLAAMARRDFGAKASDGVIKAWGIFSEAFSRFPYAGGITGFPYWRGPFYLGPAHPFIFDALVVTGLSEKFCTPNPGIEEVTTDPATIESSRELRYFPDLTWTQPFGVEIMSKRLNEIHRAWQSGIAQLTKSLRVTRGDDRERLQDELRVAQYIGCMFHTAANLARFQQLRENITAKPCTPKRLRDTCVGAICILRDEIENAELGLKLVECDRSLGYSASYGYALDAEMVREKIVHSLKQINSVIPAYFSQYAFHLFGSYESLKA